MTKLDPTYVEFVLKVSNELFDGKLPDPERDADFLAALVALVYADQPTAIWACAAENLTHAVQTVRCRHQSEYWRN